MSWIIVIRIIEIGFRYMGHGHIFRFCGFKELTARFSVKNVEKLQLMFIKMIN